MSTALAHADALQSLLMPGPLITAHEKYEDNCDQCHDTSDKNRQGQLCMSCHTHKNIADDLNKKTGYHGRLPVQSVNNCKHCHTDHEGRDVNIILLNTSTFDHNSTDFKLIGIHKKTPCQTCHKTDKKYSEAPAECYSCHEDSDVHNGKQGKKCGSCHNANSWQKTEFDHDKTDFSLKGEHNKITCSACHVNQQYKNTPKDCYSCHQINDAHLGNFGNKCGSCHNTEQWNKALFDHDKKTDFPLAGKHEKVSCNSCHLQTHLKSVQKKLKTPKDCFSCHKNDDSHKGRYGKECRDCHTPASWKKSKFDHDRDTKYKLSGKHKNTACTQCHKGDLYKDKLKSTCIDCHKINDIHKGSQGKQCNNCHNETGWHNGVSFDHDLAKFPLIGMHAATQCEECHITDNYSETDTNCNYCHTKDDAHKSKLGTNCDSCHNPNSWNTWLFDHNKATLFKLDGAHDKLGCYDCHQTVMDGEINISSDCISCHRNRDIHNRLFGNRCDDCHSTKNFTDIKIQR